MGKQQKLKFFLILVISTTFLLSFSHYGNAAFQSMFKHDEGYAEGTKIGSIDIASLSKTEAKDKIINAVQVWQEKNVTMVQLVEMKKQFDNRAFQFDVQKSLDQATDGQENQMYVNINEDVYHDFFQSLKSSVINDVELDEVKKEMINSASMLKRKNSAIHLLDYIPSEKKKDMTLSESRYPELVGQPDLTKWTNEVQEITLPAHQKISILTLLAEKNMTLSRSSLDILGSLLYKAILPTNIEILERHIGLTLPSYIEKGYEAKIIPGKMDLTFVNPNDINYKIKFKNKNGTLVVSFIGTPFYFHYRAQTANLETYKPKTIIQYSAQLQAGQNEVTEEGKDGFNVKMIRETLNENGQVIASKIISEDYYAPVYRVEVESLQKNNYEQSIDSEQGTETTTPNNATTAEKADQIDENLFENHDKVIK